MTESVISIEEAVRSAVAAEEGKIGALLPVLHRIQDKLGHVPRAAVESIAQAMSLSRAEIHGVISFYHDFRTEPVGKHLVHLCRAEACQAMGSRDLEHHVRQRLGIDFGETSADGRFSLEAVYCLGNCACSPSIRVGDDTHARVSAARFDELLTELQAED